MFGHEPPMYFRSITANALSLAGKGPCGKSGSCTVAEDDQIVVLQGESLSCIVRWKALAFMYVHIC